MNNKLTPNNSDVSLIENVSRRGFLKGTSAAVASFSLKCSIPLSFANMLQAQTNLDSTDPANPEHLILNLFVSIAENNQVFITCHRSEMGQGIRTSIAQIVADEMEADWQYVEVLQAIGDKRYGDQNTDGSKSIRQFYTPLRQFGASANLMLRQAAAHIWQVPVEQCLAKNHHVIHKPTGQSLSYGALAKQAAEQTIPNKKSLILKDTSKFNYIGKGINSLDLADMTNGKAIYGQDIVIPNMVYACLKRSPVMGSKIKSYNAVNSRSVAGVIDVVKIEGQPLPANFNPLASLAIIAKHSWAAIKGVKNLQVEWEQPSASSQTYANYNSEQSLAKMTEQIAQLKGKSIAKSDKQFKKPNELTEFSATYTLPYISHAPMEPPAATAMFHDNGNCEIWSCVQSPQAVQKKVADTLGIAIEKVKVNVTFLGGAFGRKAQPDFVLEAVVLAKKLNQPVKVIWTREDDIQHDYYHTASVIHHQALLSKEAQTPNLYEWHTRSSFSAIQSLWNINQVQPNKFEMADIIRENFSINKMSTEVIDTPAQTRIGWLRSVANIQHAFSIGSFMDEVAHQLKLDNKTHWFNLLGNAPTNQRLKQCIAKVCDMADWDTRNKLPPGEALGLAAHRSFASDIAVISHIKIANNKLTVKNVYICADVGTVVNIDRVKAQMEGAVIFGLSIALYNKISFADGKVLQSNFHNYPVLRLAESPDIAVHIVPSQANPGGVGEPGVPPVAPSVVNAIFAANQQRHRSLPLNQFYRI